MSSKSAGRKARPGAPARAHKKNASSRAKTPAPAKPKRRTPHLLQEKLDAFIEWLARTGSVKVAQFVLLQTNGDGTAPAIMSMWGEEDWAVWAAIVTFWFGNRTFNKERGRG